MVSWDMLVPKRIAGNPVAAAKYAQRVLRRRDHLCRAFQVSPVVLDGATDNASSTVIERRWDEPSAQLNLFDYPEPSGSSLYTPPEPYKAPDVSQH